ncbi:hypothetical protein Tco_0341340 [Tanacetum coccineum]
MILSLNQKSDAKSGSVDRGFVVLIINGGIGVVSIGGRVKATSFSKAVILSLNQKSDAKSGSVDRGFVVLIINGGLGVVSIGEGVKGLLMTDFAGLVVDFLTDFLTRLPFMTVYRVPLKKDNNVFFKEGDQVSLTPVLLQIIKEIFETSKVSLNIPSCLVESEEDVILVYRIRRMKQCTLQGHPQVMRNAYSNRVSAIASRTT